MNVALLLRCDERGLSLRQERAADQRPLVFGGFSGLRIVLGALGTEPGLLDWFFRKGI
jgi:hypothetical protein